MSPVIKHLYAMLPELPSTHEDTTLQWTFTQARHALGADFYRKAFSLQPILSLEYSILCCQLRQSLLCPEFASKEQIIELLKSALIYSELLEYIHSHYLIVPREVFRLRKQQQLYRSLLTHVGYTFTVNLLEDVDVGLSLSQQVREYTIQANWYRILANRGKRFVNLLNNVLPNTPVFNDFVTHLDTYMNPALNYFGLFFHMPRLLVSLFMMAKHTIAGSWMSEEEKSLNWTARFTAQIKRRYFELGNDLVWTVVALLNGFILVGPLAPIALYLSVAAFAFDVVNAAIRAYVELKRLYSLQEEYQRQLKEAEDPQQQEAINKHLAAVNARINFEQIRFGIHVPGTVLILAAMAIALPVFALNPYLILASAVFLLVLWGVSFTLTRKLEEYRPKENIELPPSDSKPPRVSQLGLFAAKPPTEGAVVTSELSRESTEAASVFSN